MASDSISEDAAPTAEPQRGCMSLSFLALLVTHFLGAANDHAFRWLVTGIGKQYSHEPGHNSALSESTVLAVGAASFILPYVLLAAPAGYLADRFSKRRVIYWCKVAEIGVMALALLAIHIGRLDGMLGLLVLLGTQATLFAPAKLGSIPEMLHPRSISLANGLMGMVTVVAIVAGTVIGNWLGSPSVTGPKGQEAPLLIGSILIGIAVAGTLTSLFIQRLEAKNPTLRFPRNFAVQTVNDLRTLYASRPLFLAVIGSMFFWSLCALFHLTIDQFVSEGVMEGGTKEQMQVTPALAATVIGVALGSVLAGIWSRGHVELGIVPLGALGLVAFTFLLFTINHPLIDRNESYTGYYMLAWFYFGMLGISAGLFEVPLNSYIQHHSRPHERGAVLAANNFLVFSGSLGFTLLFMLLRSKWGTGEPLVSARAIFLMCSLITLPALVIIVRLLPQATVKFLAWLVAHTSYRINLNDRDNLPTEGGALLVANHVTWIDGLLLFSCSSRPIRPLIKANLLNSWWSRWLARLMGVLPVPANPKAAQRVLAEARTALGRGELVCLFAEGNITRSGQLQSFSRGTLSLVRGTGVPVVPVYLDELWGSIFSYRPARWWDRWFGKWSRRISIWFGRPMYDVQRAEEVRHAVAKLGARATMNRFERTMTVARTMIRTCRHTAFRWKVADSTGESITGINVLLRSLILRRLLLREVLQRDEQYVGLLLPPANGSVITNAAVALAGRVAVNLNYSVSQSVMDACIKKAGIRHVLTSRRVIEKFDFTFGDAEVIYLDDLRDKLRTSDKFVSALLAYATPAWVVDWLLGLHKVKADDPLTVIFTSGSTGEPKGVVLTYRNIASNIDAIDQVIHLRSEDTMLGILPFFHSFGYTVTLWGPLALDIRAVYHYNPLDAKLIGKVAEKWKPTILLATPTFLRSFVKRVAPDQFASLDVVVAGAERLPPALSDDFEKRFGVRPVEGYGATELSPLVSVNVPPSRSHHTQVDAKEGTVGRPVPGVAAKIVDPDSGERLPVDTPGMLLVTGPNVMQGYLHQPDKTASVMRDGWYITGDIAKLDSDGFITITGRESRFSKIGGEMVPHLKIEEAIEEFLGIDDNDDEGAKLVVTAVPDVRKGERLIVVHRPLAKSPSEIAAGLRAAGLPNLWIPASDSYLRVEQIPVLGSGKLDLKGVAELAKRHFPPDDAAGNDE